MSKYVSKASIVWLIILPWLTACSFLTERLDAPVELLLLPPAQGPAAGILKNKVTMSSGDKQQSFIVVSRFSVTTFQVVVLTPTGQRVMSMRYDGKQFQSENKTELELPTREMMAVMQFALWPQASVRQAYQSHGTIWIEDSVRRLNNGDATTLEVQTGKDEAVIHHYPHHYTVTIQPLESTTP